MRDFRSDPDAIGQVLPALPAIRQIPLAAIWPQSGSPMDRPSPRRKRLLTAYVYVDVAGGDLGGYVAFADPQLRAQLACPDRLRVRLERSVRGHGAHPAGAVGDRAADVWRDRAAALDQHALAAKTLLVLAAVPFPPWAQCGCFISWAISCLSRCGWG